ncbi:TPR-like protein [Rickenella mellea]|uniref:TPR-like protein n=1 Tax=Rickenella mellea TaxID=50990 RepID=A0A4Y7PQP7_9AGAM|nr:TPR-like protein [Rickenella mellea]
MSTSIAFVNDEHIPDGYYTIKNYGLASLVALRPREKELCGSVRASQENSFVWSITRVSHGKYLIKSCPNGLVVQCAAVPQENGVIYVDRESFYWEIQQVSPIEPDCYMILPKRESRLVWSLADGQDGTSVRIDGLDQPLPSRQLKHQVVFAQCTSNRRYWWRFMRVTDQEIENICDTSPSASQPYHATVHIYLQISVSALEFEPPPFPAFLFGRDDFISTAVDLILHKPPARLAILGPGGVGKTTVAAAIFSWEAIDIWDGDQQNMLKLLKLLDGYKQLTIVITMRGFLRPAASSIKWTRPALNPLQVLSCDAAMQAFKAITPLNDDTGLEKLVESVEYLPLAVVLLAHLGQMDISPSELLEMWLKEKTGLLSQNSGDKSDCLQTSISLSLHSPLMLQNHHALKVLKIICYLPAGVKQDSLHYIAGVTQLTILRATEILLKTGLVNPLQHGRWKVLSPVRHYVLQYYSCNMTETNLINKFYLKLAEISGSVHNTDSLDILANIAMVQDEKDNVVHILDLCLKEFDENTDVVIAVISFTWFLVKTIPSTHLVEKAITLCSSSDMKIRCEMLRVFGETNRMLSNDVKAKEALKEAQSQSQQIGDKRGAAWCLQSLATQALQEAQSQFQQIGDKRGAARCLQDLGNIHRMLNEYSAATKALTEAQSQFQQVGDKREAAWCLQSLGNIHSALNKYSAATEALTEAQSQFQQIGDKLGAAQCLKDLGDIHTASSEYSAAAEAQTEAQSQFQQIGHKRGTAQCLQSLGEIHYDLDDYSAATEALAEAQSQFQQIGDMLGAAQCLQSLGNIHSTLNEYSAAAEA